MTHVRALDHVDDGLGQVLGVVTHPLSAVAALVYVVGSVSLLAFFPRQAAVSPETAAGQVAAAPTEVIAEDQLAEFDKWIEAQPRVQLPVSADGARVVVVKFNDYQCPSCRQTYVEYKAILDKLKTDGMFVRGLAPEPDAEAVVTAIIGLAHALHLGTVEVLLDQAGERGAHHWKAIDQQNLHCAPNPFLGRR